MGIFGFFKKNSIGNPAMKPEPGEKMVIFNEWKL